MTNITEKEIIEFLEMKIKYYRSEALRIETLLSALSNNTIGASSLSDESPMSIMAPPPHSQKLSIQDRKPASRVKPLFVPEYYRPELSINRKIAYVLSQIKSGIKEEIAAQIIKLQPDLKMEPVIKQISTVLSELKTKNLLTITKEGRKYRYSLPEQNTDRQ